MYKVCYEDTQLTWCCIISLNTYMKMCYEGVQLTWWSTYISISNMYLYVLGHIKCVTMVRR